MANRSGCDKTNHNGTTRKIQFSKWSKVFLAELAATSNVSASARKAKVSGTTVYDARRTRPEFNRLWQAALCEGYDHLEMELLHRLRSGELKPAAGARRATRSYDNAAALRLLAAHREAVARSRAIRDNEDAATVIVSINAKLETMRERLLAAAQARGAGADSLFLGAGAATRDDGDDGDEAADHAA